MPQTDSHMYVCLGKRVCGMLVSVITLRHNCFDVQSAMGDMYLLVLAVVAHAIITLGVGAGAGL